MKILVVDELCYPQLGGIQVRFKALAEQWAAQGHEVQVTAVDHIGTSPQQEVINGVVYNRVLKDANYYKNGIMGRRISTIIRYAFKLDRFFKQEWDVIIFCQFPMLPQVFYKVFYKKRAQTILDFVEYRNSALWKVINNIILNTVDKVVCITNGIKKQVSNYRQHDLHIIPSFFDMRDTVSESKSNYIFLGRMEKHKHPDHAIEAVIAYNKIHGKITILDVVGDGAMFEELKTKFENIPFIRFHGKVDDEKKKKLLANARILILPSEREGLPIVIIEAMAYGVPCLTTEYPGNGAKDFVTDEKIGKVALPTIDDLTLALHDMEQSYGNYVNTCNAIKGNFDLTLISENYLKIAQQA